MQKIIFSSIEEYIDVHPPEVARKLRQLETYIREAAPGAERTISYNMPAFKQDGPIAYFAAFKNHIGFYPTSTPILHFKKELENYPTSKGAIQFPLSKPIPKGLVQKIIRFKIKENGEKVVLKRKAKRQSA